MRADLWERYKEPSAVILRTGGVWEPTHGRAGEHWRGEEAIWGSVKVRTRASRWVVQVLAWGDKENGVCGVGEADGHQYFPRMIETLRGERDWPGLAVPFFAEF
jgi:hypothetical protein